MTMFKNGFSVSQGTQNYAKVTLGENRFRILSPAITGFVGWADKKPFRSEQITTQKFDQPAKPFMAFVVWNYLQKEIQILEITWKTIQKKIFELSQDKEWGDAYGYDIKIMKSGSGMDTTYSLTPCPKSPIADEIKKAAAEKPCNLQAFLTGEDPWTVEAGKETTLELDSLPF